MRPAASRTAIVRILTLTGLVAAALAAGAGASSAARSAWVATRTQAVHLTGSLLGNAPAATRLQISVALPLRDTSRINSLIESRTVLTRAQAQAQFSPTASTAAAVARYLASRGFTNLAIAPDRLLVSGQATVAQAEKAFDTTIASYRLNGQTVLANTSAAQVPAALAGKVAAVLGLSNVPMGLPHLTAAKHTVATGVVPAASGSPDLTGFTPQAVQHAYQADGMPAATGIETAIIAAGDMTPTIKDLRGAEKYFGFPQVAVNVIPDSPYSDQSTNPLTGSLEWSLDTQYSTMMASTAHETVKALDIYDIGTFTDSEVARGINMFVSDDRASALSISLGECDVLAFLDGAMIASDNELALGALQGQSSFSSTGDNGYACPEVASTGVPEGPPGDSWPAVGEYTVGAGGTTLLADSDGNVQNEIAWVGGGGGVDPYEAAAPWTLQANPYGQGWQYFNQGGRAIPDAAAVADSNTPVLVYSGSGPTGVGGTSVSSPVLEGLWDRINNTAGASYGLAQYDFYAVYDQTNPATIGTSPIGSAYYIPDTSPGPVTGLRDITVGTNGGCVALPGWDDCSGVGALQAADLAKALTNPALDLPKTGIAGGSQDSQPQNNQPPGPQSNSAPASSASSPAPSSPSAASSPTSASQGTAGRSTTDKSTKRHRTKKHGRKLRRRVRKHRKAQLKHRK